MKKKRVPPWRNPFVTVQRSLAGDEVPVLAAVGGLTENLPPSYFICPALRTYGILLLVQNEGSSAANHHHDNRYDNNQMHDAPPWLLKLIK